MHLRDLDGGFRLPDAPLPMNVALRNSEHLWQRSLPPFPGVNHIIVFKISTFFALFCLITARGADNLTSSIETTAWPGGQPAGRVSPPRPHTLPA